ncbi:MAG: HAD family hydrolase [Dehalococcoidia bacterium]|nr:HAD family hydrolase [Dehalococcoidia bacterium]
MKYRALISDLDGTLLDTLEDLADSVNIALAKIGLPPHEVDAYRYFVGDGRRAMALRALPEDRRDEATLEMLLPHIDEEYTRRWMDKSAPYDGIPELLDTLTSAGIRMAILSNKPHNYTVTMVSRLLPLWSFEFVLGESVSTPRKPDPSGALHIIEQMNIRPEECLYLGDSGVDMQTATAANLYPIGVLWGFRTADELLSNGARTLVERPADILHLLCD